MANDHGDVFAGPIPDDLDNEGKLFCQNVNWLWGAHSSFLKSDVSIAEGNLHLMAYMVRWHATVSPSNKRFPGSF